MIRFHTRVSKLFNRLLNSASSGEVISIRLSFCTMTPANSRSLKTVCYRFSRIPKNRAHFFAFQQLCKSPINLLRVQIQTQLSDDQAPSRFQQPSVGTEEFQEVVHEYSEVTLFRTSGDLSDELEVVFYHFLRGVGEGLEEGGECAIIHGKNLLTQSQSIARFRVSRGIPLETSDAT